VDKLKVGVLISGRGSNLQALIDAGNAGDYPAKIVTVIANTADAGGLMWAERARIPAFVIDHRNRGRQSFEAEIDRALTAAGVECVCLAGFMRVLSAEFVERWRDRLINVHPSLLPAFRGIDVHRRVLAAGARFSGCTVHFVRAEADAGPIIVQAVVAVRPEDTEETLAARVLEMEHKIYPLALRWIAEKRVAIEDEIVKIAGVRAEARSLYNPLAGGEESSSPAR
jgi:phosphoribosylglycinamide formyltransferase-1